VGNSVMSGVGIFLTVYAVGIASWIIGVFLHLRARQYYLGPKGWALIFKPFAQYMSKNYTADGVSLLRWEFICMGIFTMACIVGLVIARIKTLGHL